MEWDGRVVLITGGSRGIGLATAKRFLAAGASVMVTGRSEEALAAALTHLNDAERRRGDRTMHKTRDTDAISYRPSEPGLRPGERPVYGEHRSGMTGGSGGSPPRTSTGVVPPDQHRVRGVTADVCSVAGCEAAVAAAADAFGRLDLLFTNAGGYESAPLEEVTEELWDRTIDTHLKGTFFCVQAAAPALREARGCVVTMASDAGLLGMRAGWAAYCAAMGGVVNLTRQLALDLAPDVRVNAVAPGPVGTEQLYADLSSATYGGFEGAPDAVAALTGTLPVGRLIEPDEIARAVYFLAGMPAMTGSVLSVDGGTSIALP